MQMSEFDRPKDSGDSSIHCRFLIQVYFLKFFDETITNTSEVLAL